MPEERECPKCHGKGYPGWRDNIRCDLCGGKGRLIKNEGQSEPRGWNDPYVIILDPDNF